MENFDQKLQDFLALAEKETQHRMHMEGYDSLLASAEKAGRRAYYYFTCEPGLKFVKVWKEAQGSKSIHTFVEISTGIIYGADGWKKPNFKRAYGTLDTIKDWCWSGYYGVSKKGVDTLVPKEKRRKP